MNLVRTFVQMTTNLSEIIDCTTNQHGFPVQEIISEKL
jgi:hypothetical protein